MRFNIPDEDHTKPWHLSGLKEASGSLTIQRSSKGPLSISGIGHAGEYVVIENSTSGARAKDERANMGDELNEENEPEPVNQSLKGWRLVKTVNGKDTISVPLKEIELKAGQKFTLWAKGSKDVATAEDEQVADYLSFGVGSCIWKLVDEGGAEKATLNAKFSV